MAHLIVAPLTLGAPVERGMGTVPFAAPRPCGCPVCGMQLVQEE